MPELTEKEAIRIIAGSVCNTLGSFKIDISSGAQKHVEAFVTNLLMSSVPEEHRSMLAHNVMDKLCSEAKNGWLSENEDHQNEIVNALRREFDGGSSFVH